MVFLHSGARDFDLGGGFQHSGNYPMVFLHSGARDFDHLGEGFNTQVITLWCFYIGPAHGPESEGVAQVRILAWE